MYDLFQLVPACHVFHQSAGENQLELFLKTQGGYKAVRVITLRQVIIFTYDVDMHEVP